MLKSLASLFLFGLLSSSAVQAALPATSDEVLQSRFVSWMDQHGLDFAPQEMFTRFSTFKSNLATIEAHNEKAAAGKYSFRLGLTQFAAMTNEEYRSKVLGLSRRSRSVASGAAGTFEPQEMDPLPASVDWRAKNVVTPVKNQGQCGSCWSFSATGAMEGAHALATGNLVSLSEQELVDCVNGGADTCDAGGEMHDGYLEVIAAGGIESEADYPYTATSGNKCVSDSTKYVATFSSYLNVTSGDEAALAAAVNEKPTISIGIDASSMWFQLYMGGVYDVSGCKNAWDQLDHGVLAVGFGHDDSSSKDFWLVKNSWGGSWGESGYIRMVRNKDNQCGVATDATFPLV